MMFGRFAVAIPALALAGALAGKKAVPEASGTFTTHSPIFVALLIGVIVIVGALTFLPADALGPIVEHLSSTKERRSECCQHAAWSAARKRVRSSIARSSRARSATRS